MTPRNASHSRQTSLSSVNSLTSESVLVFSQVRCKPLDANLNDPAKLLEPFKMSVIETKRDEGLEIANH